MRLRTLAVVLAAALAAGVATGPAEGLGPGGDWPGYLNGPQHSSWAASETAITTANAAKLRMRWRFLPDPSTSPDQPARTLFSSPTVADGAVYIGSNNGYLYKLDLTTGAVLSSVFVGYRPKLTCNGQGFVSTATVATDPADGLDTVYVAAADGYLYALNLDLTTKWRALVDLPSDTVSDYFNWSSPTVANGRIYLGSASDCDTPLTRGAIVSYDQASGTELGRYYTVPEGFVGGGVWTSVAVADDGSLYSTTGTEVPDSTDRYESVSIIHLDGTTLAPLGTFTVPDAEVTEDGDFGGSPVVFGGLVGACNKNGIFYALDRATMTLQWERRIGSKSSPGGLQCSAAAVYDGASLYVAGPPTTIAGRAYRGSVRRLNPATGAVLWQRGLPNSVLGTPSANGAGLLAVGTFDNTATKNAVYLLNAGTGKVVRTLNTGGHNFGQSVFADGWVLTTNVNTGLRGYHLP